ncbi:AAA family ATPase [Agrobacterium rosae]|uniref:AAA family ATPase n=1 Tax=Agrobacterium rosae TaxID=1972867 RepID=UPI00203421E1|nr:AAA family ATPase [Agrobacterium rosae]
MTFQSASNEPVYLNAAEIAAALGGKARGNQISAPAPGHSKRDLSLRVMIDPFAPEGFVVHPLAGEDPIDMRDYVRTKAGLPDWQSGGNQQAHSTAIYKPAKKPEPPKPFSDYYLISNGYRHAKTYEYTSVDGEILFEVLRYEHDTEPKTFVQRRPDEKAGWLSGRLEPMLYRSHEIASNLTDPVFVVEGEKDADRLAEFGYLATTVPNGSWPEDISILSGRIVYVLADNDPAGDKKATDAIRRLSSVATSYRIDLPDLPEKGDVSDWLDAGNTTDMLESICQQASPVPANDNVPTEPALSIFDWTVDRFKGEPPKVEYLVDGVMPAGVPGMVSAMGDTGKSYAMLELHRRVSFGSSMYDTPIFGGKVLARGTSVMITSEDDAGEVHRRIAAIDRKEDRFTELGAKMIVVPLPSVGGAQAFWKEDRRHGLLETDHYRRICDQLSKIDDLRVVTFDPLASFAHLPLNEDPAAGQFVCTSLSRLATETGATVLVAHHMRKTQKPIETLGDARDSIRGSTALVDGLRLAYAMWPADDARAKRVCKETGTEFMPGKVVLGGVVKANGAARRIISTYVRNEHGLLVDKTALLGSSTPPTGDLIGALVVTIEAAANAGSPFTKSGASGVYEMRERLPDELRSLSKARIHALVDTALDDTKIVKTAAKGEKIAKWLDVPGGHFATGLGSFTTGAPHLRK